jgi:hypothetical protein
VFAREKLIHGSGWAEVRDENRHSLRLQVKVKRCLAACHLDHQSGLFALKNELVFDAHTYRQIAIEKPDRAANDRWQMNEPPLSDICQSPQPDLII